MNVLDTMNPPKPAMEHNPIDRPSCFFLDEMQSSLYAFLLGEIHVDTKAKAVRSYDHFINDEADSTSVTASSKELGRNMSVKYLSDGTPDAGANPSVNFLYAPPEDQGRRGSLTGRVSAVKDEHRLAQTQTRIHSFDRTPDVERTTTRLDHPGGHDNAPRPKPASAGINRIRDLCVGIISAVRQSAACKNLAFAGAIRTATVSDLAESFSAALFAGSTLRHLQEITRAVALRYLAPGKPRALCHFSEPQNTNRGREQNPPVSGLFFGVN